MGGQVGFAMVEEFGKKSTTAAIVVSTSVDLDPIYLFGGRVLGRGAVVLFVMQVRHRPHVNQLQGGPGVTGQNILPPTPTL